jgi:antitoxin ParD1/3/4
VERIAARDESVHGVVEVFGDAAVNISLPEALNAFIQDEVKRGAYSTPSEFVRELVREAQKRRARDEERILHAVLSGDRIADAPQLERARGRLRE